MIVRLNGVRGAVNGAGMASPLRAREIHSGSTPSVPGRSEASRHGVARRDSAPPTASSSAPDPPAVSLTRSGSSAGSSGVSVHSWDIMLAPVTPSTVEWCILAKQATRPSGSPSMRYICQSGMDRSMGWLARCAHSSASSSSPPGAGSPTRWRWWSMSKSSDSTHTGWSTLSIESCS